MPYEFDFGIIASKIQYISERMKNMENQNICLKQIEDRTEATMLEILTSDIVKQTYMLPDFSCREDAIPLFRRLVNLSTDETRYMRGIYCDENLIGFLNDVEILDGSIELGYVIHPLFRGKGYMTQALKIAIAELFSCGYEEVIAGAFEENIASIRVMEKAGMTKMEKADEIEYRGKVHRCIYYHKDKRLVKV